jgi:hypothetical protein
MEQASSHPANRPTCLPILLEDASSLVITSPLLISISPEYISSLGMTMMVFAVARTRIHPSEVTEGG